MTTSPGPGPVRSAQRGGEAVARRREFEWMARVGLVARGVVGLAGYAVWRLVRAGIGHGTEQKDSGFQRIAGLVSGVAYAALCVTAVKSLAGASAAAVDRTARSRQPRAC
jgi:hypothetical protein